MNDHETLQIAENTFRVISERFPSLEMKRNTTDPVELSMDIPVQPGLKYAVNLNLQNLDELHFSVGNFWLEWFPCTQPSKVAAYIDAVSGFLAGRYRVLEHYRGNKCVKAELQTPESQGEWKTIGTYTLLWPPFPWRKHFKELINA